MVFTWVSGIGSGHFHVVDQSVGASLGRGKCRCHHYQRHIVWYKRSHTLVPDYLILNERLPKSFISIEHILNTTIVSRVLEWRNLEVGNTQFGLPW